MGVMGGTQHSRLVVSLMAMGIIHQDQTGFDAAEVHATTIGQRFRNPNDGSGYEVLLSGYEVLLRKTWGVSESNAQASSRAPATASRTILATNYRFGETGQYLIRRRSVDAPEEGCLSGAKN